MRNSKLEIRNSEKRVPRPNRAQFRFSNFNFLLQPSAIDNRQSAILTGFSPNRMQEILEVPLRPRQDAFGLGQLAEAELQQLA